MGAHSKTKTIGCIAAISLLFLLVWTHPSSAQTFSSGSTGADGAFAPSANTTLALPADGVFNFTTVTIPAGVTVTFTPNAANTPVTILATGDITIGGTLQADGAIGAAASGSGPVINVGAAGGPGGFRGGNGEARGGGTGPSPGQGFDGGDIGNFVLFTQTNGNYGVSSAFVALLPLFGGSGGGGGLAPVGQSGAAGSGGGGALVLASSTQIAVNGSILANGAAAVLCNQSQRQEIPGAGSGGAVRLVAPTISGTGALTATGGFHCPPFGAGGSPTFAGDGRIRLEAFTLGFSGTTDPAPSKTAAPGPVTSASNPALINLPTLTVTTVGGIAAPATPGGSYSVADLSLPQGTTNPVPVTLTATNIPVGTVYTVNLVPQTGNAVSVGSPPSTGTFATSTATTNVTFPVGEVSLLNVFSSFTLPTQTASLFPLIDGEPVDRLMVAAVYGGPSTLSLITTSGREIRAADLSPSDQAQLSRAFALAQATSP